MCPSIAGNTFIKCILSYKSGEQQKTETRFKSDNRGNILTLLMGALKNAGLKDLF